MLNGIGASQGYGIGKVFLKKPLEKIEKKHVLDSLSECQKLEDAFIKAKDDLKAEYESKRQTLGDDHAEIFKAHLAMLEDPELETAMFDAIKQENINAEYAVEGVIQTYVEMFENLEDAYFKERALDIKDIGNRLVKKLIGHADEDMVGDNWIVVAKDLTPSDTAKLDLNKVKGMVTAQGGDTSHSAIIARTLGIPAVMGVKDIDQKVSMSMPIICDGFSGDIYLEPSDDIVKAYVLKQEVYEKEQLALMTFKDAPSVTKCGKHLELSANIASPDDVDGALAYGADGVGLFRSEFIYMNRQSAPTEDEQFMAYKAVLIGMKGKPVVIRTLDAGGDKEIPYLDIPHEMNPFLGYRAIRVCFDRLDLFKTQLRALYRASVFGDLKIMFPMISSLEEVRKAKAIISDVKKELDSEGLAYENDVEVGIMIEIPSAAIISDILAKEVDFFSIGTNDLIQYTNAVDRMNEAIKDLYTAYHPAILRLIQTTIKNGLENGIWVGMCGSVAGNAKMFPILVAMGLTEFSMGPNQILKCREIASKHTVSELKVHLDHVMSLATATDIEAYLTRLQHLL